MKSRRVHRTVAAGVAIAMGLLSPSLARAEETAVQSQPKYKLSRRLGAAGMVMGYGGPVIQLLGMSGSPEYALTGMMTSHLGTSLLASSAVMGASAVQASGGQVGAGLGWGSVAGAGTLLVSHVRWAPSLHDSFMGFVAMGMVGWSTGMVTGTLQHRKNRKAWTALGMSQAQVEPKRVSLQLAPTATGARVFGSF